MQLIIAEGAIDYELSLLHSTSSDAQTLVFD